MSMEMSIECRKCGSMGMGYTEGKIQYLAELCHDEECRYFYSEECGKVLSEGVMDMDEYEGHNLSPYKYG